MASDSRRETEMVRWAIITHTQTDISSDFSRSLAITIARSVKRPFAATKLVVGRDASEKAALLNRRRQEFERALQLNRRDLPQWIRYADLEVEAGFVDQARSIYERGLAVDYTYVPLWYRYAQTEARFRQFTAARTVLERAIQLLPLESKLYLTLLEYEEIRGNIDYCETVFERWAKTGSSDVWEPWIYFARRYEDQESLRNPLEMVISRRDQSEDGFVVSPTTSASSATDKRTGSLIKTNRSDAELWWISLNDETSPELFELAIKNCKPESTHPFGRWHSFALLWLRYAITAESNGEAAHEIYDRALKSFDHGKISSVTLWTNYLAYLIRQQAPLSQCRKLFGSALGKTRENLQANPLILETYARFEIRMNELERTRKLLGMLCTNWPQLARSWSTFAKFEARLAEHERSKHLFESSLQLSLDDADSLWVSYFETTADYYSVDSAREIAQRALKNPQVREKADMVAQVAMFELGLGLSSLEAVPDKISVEKAREIFEDGATTLEGEQRGTVYDLYIQFEMEYGDTDRIPVLQARADANAEDDILQEEAILDTSSSDDSSNSESTDTDSSNSISNSPGSSNSGTNNPALARLLASAKQWKHEKDASGQ